MASIPHVYRRGHIFWWRRIHRLLNGLQLDVRLSLRTGDRMQARDRGAVLASMRGDVTAMLEDRIKASDARLTEADLQAMAKAAYEEKLGQFCDQQRAHPAHRTTHSAMNTAYADYYDVLIDKDGVAPFGDERTVAAYTALGWPAERVERLFQVLKHHETGQAAISPATVDHFLREFGYTPHAGLRRMVERVLRVAYRDACLAAEASLQGQPLPVLHRRASTTTIDAVDDRPIAPAAVLSPAPSAPPTVIDPGAAVHDSWATLTATEAAERFIAENPKMFSHRQTGKRAKQLVGETQGTLALMRVTAWIRYGLGLLPCDDHCRGKVMRCLAWLRMIARSTEPRQRWACAEAMKSFTSAVLLCWP